MPRILRGESLRGFCDMLHIEPLCVGNVKRVRDACVSDVPGNRLGGPSPQYGVTPVMGNSPSRSGQSPQPGCRLEYNFASLIGKFDV